MSPLVWPLLPKIVMVVVMFAGLGFDFLGGPRGRLIALLSTVLLLVIGVVGGLVGLGVEDSLWHEALRIDRLSVFTDLVLLVLTVLLVLALVDRRHQIGEESDFILLMFLSLVGASVLASAGNLIVLFIGIELSVIPTFALVAFHSRDRRSFEAALKYFVLAIFAGAVLLYGLSLVYGATGSIALPFQGEPEGSALLYGGIALVLVGFGFKLAAFPFHQWLPDSFDVSHSEVGAFLSVAPKIAAVVALVRFVDGFSGVSEGWTIAVAAIAVATMVYGNLTAFVQTRLKRMLAYSAVAHSGYALVGVAAGTPGGFEGAVIYFAAYGTGAVGAFLVISALAREGRTDAIAGFRGLGGRRPLLAAAMAVFLISLIGIPLFAGFWGKLSVFWGAVQAGAVWLAVIGVLNSAASFGYYGNVLRLMYLEEAGEGGVEGLEERGPEPYAGPEVMPEPQIVSESVPAHPASGEAGSGIGWGISVAVALAVVLTLALGIIPGLLFGAV